MVARPEVCRHFCCEHFPFQSDPMEPGALVHQISRWRQSRCQQVEVAWKSKATFGGGGAHIQAAPLKLILASDNPRGASRAPGTKAAATPSQAPPRSGCGVVQITQLAWLGPHSIGESRILIHVLPKSGFAKFEKPIRVLPKSGFVKLQIRFTLFWGHGFEWGVNLLPE